MKIFEKITRIFVSRKLNRIVYSYLDAQCATFKIALTASHYWVAIFKLGKKIEFKPENRKHFLIIAIYDIAQTCINS